MSTCTHYENSRQVLQPADGDRNTTQLLLTKGDNNDDHDVVLYNGLEWIERQHIIGKVRG